MTLAGERPGAATLLLDAHAAGRCPVRTQNDFDPTLPAPTMTSDGMAVERRAAAERVRAEVLDGWASCCSGLVDLRTRATGTDRLAVSREALRAGAPVVLGAVLPADPAGHRRGRPDALVRGPDLADRPAYYPVVVQNHLIADRRRPEHASRQVLTYSALAQPGPQHRQELSGYELRFGRREADFLALAHHLRLLQAAGLAGPAALGAVIGTDRLRSEPVLAWADLSAPVARTNVRGRAKGWDLISLLERYDAEHDTRVAVAATARRQTGRPTIDPARLVSPIRVPECARCPWWAHCATQFDPDDVSLRITATPLDRREIEALRQRKLSTVTALAAAEVDALLPDYLPAVAHRIGAEARLRAAARRAGMLVAGVAVARESTGPIDVPDAAVEVDFDLESSAAGRIYLWGFGIRDASGAPPRYVHFSRFADLDEDAEHDLAVRALTWLRELVQESASVRVYHYSGYEVAQITDLARRHPGPVLDWAASYAAGEFVDLLTIVQQHFFGVAGLGLKSMARVAGFRWRDEEPGGLNSQRWFAEAVHAETAEQRAAAARRVLAYNEDDVLATHELRRWLRAQPA